MSVFRGRGLGRSACPVLDRPGVGEDQAERPEQPKTPMTRTPEGERVIGR